MEHERNIVVQQTMAGLLAARARGRNGGRPKGLVEKYKGIAIPVKDLYDAGKQLTAQIMKAFGIGSRWMFCKILDHTGADVNGFEKKKRRKRSKKMQLPSKK